MSRKPKMFIEGVHPPEAREFLPEDLSGVQYISLEGDRAGKQGVRCVDGYYKVPESEDTPIRQIREYDVDSEEAAVERARKDGLVQGIMVETILTEAMPCNLGKSPDRSYLNH